jgi:hypothetical protein
MTRRATHVPAGTAVVLVLFVVVVVLLFIGANA